MSETMLLPGCRSTTSAHDGRRANSPWSAHSGWLLALTWLLSRGAMAWVWSERAQFIRHDVYYYFFELRNAAPNTESLIEYPTPIVWLLEGIRGLAGNEWAFEAWFVAAMVLLDAGLVVVLWRYRRIAACYWTVFVFAIGALVWFRIDLIPAAAVALSLVWFTRRPFASGAAMAIGAATKLWPALLILPLLGLTGHGRKRGLGFVTVGGALGVTSLLTAGWARSISPLTWQSDRGLQVESVLASVPMAQQGFGERSFFIHLSRYNAWEISGPGVAGWLRLSDALMMSTVVLAVLLTWLICFGGVGLRGHALAAAAQDDRRDVRRHAGTLAVVALICAVIMANKTFSPQYMIWLTGPLALLASEQLRGPDKRHAWGLAILGLAVAFGTQLVFPLNYGGVLSAHPGETTLLLVRNVAMVVMTVWATWQAFVVAWRVGRIELP